MPDVSQAYIDHLKQGPFPQHLDPWVEIGRYFQQLHSEIISHLLGQIVTPLLRMGYYVGREASLQIVESSKPDLYIQHSQDPTPPIQAWDYGQATAAVMAEPGVALTNTEPDLDALYIREVASGQVVTIVEVVSPRNKNELPLIERYQTRRLAYLAQHIHIMEIDLTRSVKRLVNDPLVDSYPYHVAVHLHDQAPRLIGMAFGEPLKRCAIPLQGDVVPVELETAYRHAYQHPVLALHIHNEIGYSMDDLPFPSLLTYEQKQGLGAAAAAWQIELERLRPQS